MADTPLPAPGDSVQGEATSGVHVSLTTNLENTELRGHEKGEMFRAGFRQQGPRQLRGALRGRQAGWGLQEGPRGPDSKVTGDVLPGGKAWATGAGWGEPIWVRPPSPFLPRRPASHRLQPLGVRVLRGSAHN